MVKDYFIKKVFHTCFSLGINSFHFCLLSSVVAYSTGPAIYTLVRVFQLLRIG